MSLCDIIVSASFFGLPAFFKKSSLFPSSSSILQAGVKFLLHKFILNNDKARTDITPKLAGSSAGETREKVAEAIGMKRSTYEAGKKVYNAAKEGNEKAQELMVQVDAGENVDQC